MRTSRARSIHYPRALMPARKTDAGGRAAQLSLAPSATRLLPLQLPALAVLAHLLQLAPTARGAVLQSVTLPACLAAARVTAYGEATTCILAPGAHRSLSSPTPVLQLRGPLTIRGAPSGSVLRGAGQVPAAGWVLDPAAGGRPIFVTTLPESLRGHIERSCVFVDDVFVSEARWPNANITNILSLNTWALTSGASKLGRVVDSPLGPASVGGLSGLAASGVDWTGARATLNVGDRFTTYVRLVKNHSAGSDTFDYSSNLGKGPGAPPANNSYAWGAGGRYWLSGKKAALDAAGEWYYEAATHKLFLWAPDSMPPVGRVSVRLKDYCVDVQARGHPFVLQGVAMHSCSFRLRGCDRCVVDSVNISYASYDPTIKIRNVPPGPLPNITLLEGNRSTIRGLHLQYANNGGLKVIGDDNVIDNVLIEDVDWLGTLDFPALEIGFDGVESEAAGAGGSAAAAHQLHARAGDRMYPRPTKGQRNHITRTTVRRFGNAGIVTSQLANEISYSHVYNGGLIGNDDACVHADNSLTSCGEKNSTDDCTKTWHHNWVHDCREKCMRGDDYTWQLHGHHLVIYNCGMGPTCREFNEINPSGCDRNAVAPAGWLSKGDYNQLYASTIFNVRAGGQGDLVASITRLDGRSGFLSNGSNRNSEFFNVAAHKVSGGGRGGSQSGPSPMTAKVFAKVFDGGTNTWRGLGLVDPLGFDFRPNSSSPLRHAGFVYPPFAPPVGGRAPDIGAYQHGDESPWVPGCTLPTCDSFRGREATVEW